MIFPHPLVAVQENGLLAYSTSLSASQIVCAYRFGIFPWYNEFDPVLWWFTAPRMVLFPQKVRIQKSMRPYFNQKRFHCTTNAAFPDVMNQCKQTRMDQAEGSWIHQEMEEAYHHLHLEGYAHSIEVWNREKQLVGGLYGIAIGKIFYGESMFHTVSNASKFALIHLCNYLIQKEFRLIDCQMETPHLASMGAELMPKEEFWDYIWQNLSEPDFQFTS